MRLLAYCVMPWSNRGQTAMMRAFGKRLAMIRTKRITSGSWRTVESFWNARGTAFFKALPGAQIKVRYGVGWLGFDRQKQTLNGTDYKKLEVGLGLWATTECKCGSHKQPM